MKCDIVSPIKEKIEELVDLCAAHAEFEQCDYNREHKADRLSKDLFGVNPKLFCLIAEVDEKYVGYIVWMKQYSTWDAKEYLYMDCLYLKEECRSQGIGEALVNQMKAYGRSENIDLVQWQTPDFNVRAIKFYKRIGATNLSKERFFLSIT